MSKYQRRKGHDFEREVVHFFREVGLEARRGLQYQPNSRAPDVIAPPFAVECKASKRPSYRQAWETAALLAEEGTIPIAVLKEPRKEALVVISLEDFLDLVGEWLATKSL
jgi:Holliday junction resolvase